MKIEEKFKKVGYVTLRNFVDTEEFYEYCLKKMKKEKGRSDVQVPGSYAFYGDPKISKIHHELKPKIEKLIGLKLFNTYCYGRVYKTDARLEMHRDRWASEIGVTLNLGQKGKPWPFWLTDYDGNPNKVILNPGDAVIYHGCDLWHCRGKLKEGDLVAQVFLFYVDQNGPHADCKDDPEYVLEKELRQRIEKAKKEYKERLTP